MLKTAKHIVEPMINESKWYLPIKNALIETNPMYIPSISIFENEEKFKSSSFFEIG